MPKVSIGVPIYNQERLLSRCIDSLVNQTITDIEIILVNDGSTDCSLKICQEYAQRDSRIVIIDKENGGLASARQAALDAATGDFFAVCDSDDWVELSMYGNLYNRAKQENADVVICDYYENYVDGRQREISFRPKSLNPEDVLIGVLMHKFPNSMCIKLIKKEVFKKFNISWIQGINMSEDAVMTIQIARHPISYSYLEKALYHYWKEPQSGSYTSDISQKSYEELIRANLFVAELFPDEKYKPILFFRLIDLASVGLKVKNMKADIYNNVLQRININDFFKYRQFSKKTIVVFLAKLFGMRFGRLCVHTILKLHKL